MARMSAAERREAILAATRQVMLRKGMAATTVRDIAGEMGTSSGLIHHYVVSMDRLLAAAFERAAGEDLEATRRAVAAATDPVERLALFFGSYARADADWAFQLWLDAWAEAARRPAVQATSRRLNIAWQQLLAGMIRDGVAAGALVCADPDGAAWRIISLLDGLALQAVAHAEAIDRSLVVRWSAAMAESELGLPVGSLTARVPAAASPVAVPSR